jgi:MFS family permease
VRVPGVLREGQYRLLFAAQAVSLLGDSMVNVSLAFAVIGQGGSASDVGLVFTSRSLALIAFLLGGGVIGDRLPRRAVLVVTDLVRLASQAALAAALILGHPGPVAIAALSAVTGAATGVFNPTSSGFLPTVVSAAGLQQANAMRSLASSGARMVGPAVAGVLVVTVGAGWALAVDAATFAASAALLAAMRRQPRVRASGRSPLADLREGWDAFRSRTWLWTFVVWGAFGNLLYGCWAVVGPLVAARDLGGATAWGAIIATSGAGGLLGGVVALRVRPRRPLRFAAVALSVFFAPLALIALGLPVAVIAVGAALAEIGLVLGITTWESTLQRHVELGTLSRVSAYDWLGSMALQPVGLALWGPIAESIGYAHALWLAFGLSVAGAAVLLCVREIRTLPAVPQPA